MVFRPRLGRDLVKLLLSKNAEIASGQHRGTVVCDGHTLRCSDQEAIVSSGDGERL